MAGGRPREFTLPKDQLIELGKEMLDWVQKNDPLHLSQWYTIEKDIIYLEWKQMINKPEFRPYYEKCMRIIGMKYIDQEQKRIKDGVAHRFLRLYFRDLRELEDQALDDELQRKKELLEYQAKLNREDIQVYSKELEAKFDQHMNQIDRLQNNPGNLLTP